MTTTPSRILIIEDDPQVRDSIVSWLEDSGNIMLQAGDGLAGLEAYHAEEPDLVLLDMGLPKMPGMEVLRRITEQDTDTPVIIVSANARIDDAIGAFKAGAWDYVTKPIHSFEALEKTIHNCLERRALKEEIRAAEGRYHTLIQSVPAIIFSLGEGLTLDFINNTCRDITGFSPEEALDDPEWLIRYTHPDDRAALKEALDTARAAPGEGFRVDFRFEHHDGYELHLRARALETDSGPNAGLGGIITDITERVFLEKMLVQREKLNTLGAMSSELAHEIRNPLMSLGGFAKRLFDKHPDIAEASIILEQAGRLEALLKRISAYVAPVDIKPQKVNLAALLSFCLHRLSPRLVQRNLDIRPRVDLTSPPVETDLDLLTETLVNLISHITAGMTTKGRLIIELKTTPGHISLIFNLTDPDAPPLLQDPEQLLMPFEEGGGTLGLSLVYRNMKLLGGHMGYEPTEGGAVITIALARSKSGETPSPLLPA